MIRQGAYLKGFMLGDGAFCNNYPRLNLYEPKYICMKRLVASALEIPKDNLSFANRTIKAFDFKDQVTKTMTYKRMVGLTMIKSELEPWTYDYRRELPEAIMSCDLCNKADFIAGLFDADGNLTEKSYTLASINPKMLEGVKCILQSVGIDSQIKLAYESHMALFPNSKKGKYLLQDCYRLTLNRRSSVLLSEIASFERLGQI